MTKDFPEIPTGAYGMTTGSRPARPKYLFEIWVLTGLYLTFELAFNARLLDVAGGLTQPEEVNSIEKWGRCISGVALALGVWGMGIMPRAAKRAWPTSKKLLALTVSGLICVATMFTLQKALIEKLTDNSDGNSRRIATHLQLMAHALLTQGLNLDGIDLSDCTLDRPEGKTFIALFPVLAFSTNDLNRKADTAIHQIVENTVRERIGHREVFYNTTFVASVKQLREGYNKNYVPGVNEMHRALDDIPQTQAKAWNEYVADLEKRRLRPDNVPRIGWNRVRTEVQRKGVPVPNDWAPSDHATFANVIRNRVERDARQKYDKAIHGAFGEGVSLPDDLQWDQFVAHPAVQKKWHQELHLANSVALTPKMDLDAYSKAVYEPQVERTVNEQIAKYTSDAESFGPGGKLEELGKTAMRALLVPPIALAFSLMGALVHLFKFSLYSVRWVSPFTGINRAVIGAGVALLAMSVFLAPNNITRSRVYEYFRHQTGMTLGAVPATALTWVIQAQPFAYPMNEAVRVRVLRGIAFGYHQPNSGAPSCAAQGSPEQVASSPEH